MKRMKMIVCFLAAAAVGIALCGCSGSSLPEAPAADAGNYQMGDASIKDKIETIRIGWTSGSVHFESHDQDTIDIAEIINGNASEENRMHWKLDGSTLTIRSDSPSRSFKLFSFGTTKKQLTVTLPKDLNLEELDIDATSAEISVPDVKANILQTSFTSGSLDLRCVSDKVRIDATSGSVKAACEANDIQIDATSGTTRLVQKGSAERIRIDTTSGDVEAALEEFDELDISGTSSDVLLTLPKETGFTADVDVISGKFRSEIPVITENGRYTAGDGSCRIRIDLTSGDATLQAAE